MKILKINDPIILDKIRSGFTISDAISCVLELVYNSLDAKATTIAILINMRKLFVQVVDNGIGVEEANLRHMGDMYTTSKCTSVNQLESILTTYGYRGCSLASIATVCESLEIQTRTKASSTFKKTFTKGKPGKVVTCENARPFSGTTVTVGGLFWDTPVKKHRIKEVFDVEEIRREVEALAIYHSEVSFSLRNDETGKVIFQSCDSAILKNLLKLFSEDKVTLLPSASNNIKIRGYLCKHLHTDKSLQLVYVNQRIIYNSQIHQLVERSIERYGKFWDQSKNDSDYPVDVNGYIFFISIHCSYSKVIVQRDSIRATNVTFLNKSEILRVVYKAVKHALTGSSLSEKSSFPCNMERIHKEAQQSPDFGPSQLKGAILGKRVSRKEICVPVEEPAINENFAKDPLEKRSKPDFEFSGKDKDSSIIGLDGDNGVPSPFFSQQGQEGTELAENAPIFALSDNPQVGFHEFFTWLKIKAEKCNQAKRFFDEFVELKSSVAKPQHTTERKKPKASIASIREKRREKFVRGNKVTSKRVRAYYAQKKAKRFLELSSAKLFGSRVHSSTKNHSSLCTWRSHYRVLESSHSSMCREANSERPLLHVPNEADKIIHCCPRDVPGGISMPCTSAPSDILNHESPALYEVQGPSYIAASSVLNSQASPVDSCQVLRAGQAIGVPGSKAQTAFEHIGVQANVMMSDAQIVFKHIGVQANVMMSDAHTQVKVSTQSIGLQTAASCTVDVGLQCDDDITSALEESFSHSETYRKFLVNLEMARVSQPPLNTLGNSNIDLTKNTNQIINRLENCLVPTQVVPPQGLYPFSNSYNEDNLPPTPIFPTEDPEDSKVLMIKLDEQEIPCAQPSSVGTRKDSVRDIEIIDVTEDENTSERGVEITDVTEDENTSERDVEITDVTEDENIVKNGSSTENRQQGTIEKRDKRGRETRAYLLKEISAIANSSSETIRETRSEANAIRKSPLTIDLTQDNIAQFTNTDAVEVTTNEPQSKCSEAEGNPLDNDRVTTKKPQSKQSKPEGNHSNAGEVPAHELQGERKGTVGKTSKTVGKRGKRGRETEACLLKRLSVIANSSSETIWETQSEFNAIRKTLLTVDLTQDNLAQFANPDAEEVTTNKPQSKCSKAEGNPLSKDRVTTKKPQSKRSATEGNHPNAGEVPANELQGERKGTEGNSSETGKVTAIELQGERSRAEGSFLVPTKATEAKRSGTERRGESGRAEGHCSDTCKVTIKTPSGNRGGAEQNLTNTSEVTEKKPQAEGNPSEKEPSLTQSMQQLFGITESQVLVPKATWEERVSKSGTSFYVHTVSGYSMFDPPATSTRSSYGLLAKAACVPEINVEKGRNTEVPALSSSEAGAVRALFVDSCKDSSDAFVKCGSAKESEEATTQEIIRQLEERDADTAILNGAISKLDAKVQGIINPIKICKEHLTNAQVIGQLDKSFIVTLVKRPGDVKPIIVLFDQHAVDERITLEALISKYCVNGKFLSEALAAPFTLTVDRKAMAMISKNRRIFSSFGLQLKIQGRRSICVKAVPACFMRKQEREVKSNRESWLKNCVEGLLMEVIEYHYATRGVEPGNLPKELKTVIVAEACKSSKKFGTQLTFNEMKSMISRLKGCQTPFICGHGRPTAVPIYY